MTPLEVLNALNEDVATAENEGLTAFPGLYETSIDVEGALSGDTLARTRLSTAEGEFLITIWKVEG